MGRLGTQLTMKILITGDSFATDYTKKYKDKCGWPNMLANEYQVTNLAQAGCSEYKIFKQLTSLYLDDFDVILICHTSPYRIFVNNHPVHYNDPLHNNSDLIYSDLVAHVSDYPEVQSVVDFFENYFDLDHAEFVHNLICEKIEKITDNLNAKVIHITNLDHTKLHKFKNHIDFNKLFVTNAGDTNHYDAVGNKKIYQTLKNVITNLGV